MTMDEPATRGRLDEMVQGLSGKPLDRTEGPLKVSGSATYAHEWSIDNQAYGVLVRAPFANGEIQSLDKQTVLSMVGVLAVIDDERLLRNPAQGTANEAPAQGVREVVYLGQPIALVVAETFECARHAAQSLTMKYEADDSVAIDPEASDAQVEKPDDKQFSQGDVDQAMLEAAFTVDQVYRTPGHNSAAMEPHCAIAQWQDDNLTLYGSYQMLKYNRNELADSLGIDAEQVRIVSKYVGGGFGSKLGIAPEAVAAAIAAKELQRAVCVTLFRQQVFEMVMRRSETRQHFQLAADKSGVLTGLSHVSLVSNLPDETFAEPVGQASHFMYGGENRRIGLHIARLNKTCAGSVRAPGEAVGVTALENAMDELAETAGIDPVELRLLNIPEKDPEQGIPFSSKQFRQALEQGAERFGWDKRQKTPGQVRDGEWLIGMGMASAARVNMLMESEARVTLAADGSVTVETDMTDIGTGSYTILSQIAGEMLGVPMNQVEVRLGDTDLPSSAGSGGSWGASSCGSAVFVACEDLRSQICQK